MLSPARPEASAMLRPAWGAAAGPGTDCGSTPAPSRPTRRRTPHLNLDQVSVMPPTLGEGLSALWAPSVTVGDWSWSCSPPSFPGCASCPTRRSPTRRTFRCAASTISWPPCPPIRRRDAARIGVTNDRGEVVYKSLGSFDAAVRQCGNFYFNRGRPPTPTEVDTSYFVYQKARADNNLSLSIAGRLVITEDGKFVPATEDS